MLVLQWFIVYIQVYQTHSSVTLQHLNVAAQGDGNCNCILFGGDGVTIDKISVGISGTATAIAKTINLIAVEWKEIVIVAPCAMIFLM